MSDKQRIAELQAEVTRLKQALARTPGDREDGSGLLHDWSERVDRAFRGDSEDSLERRVGGVWLSRVAAVLTMTAAGIGARAAYEADELLGFTLGPWEKAGIGYLLALVFVAYGWFARHRAVRGRSTVYEALFAEAILGCGLAGIYFVTFAAAFIEPMRLFPNPVWALGPLAACVLLLAGVSHSQRSPTVAGIGFFLAYYTVVFAAALEPTFEGLLYALLTSTVLAAVTLAFHIAHRWMPLSWAAMAASYLAYVWLFAWNAASGLIAPELLFWLSQGFLGLNYLLFAITAIADSRRSSAATISAYRMAMANFLFFILLAWRAVEQAFPGQAVWLFTGVAAINAAFAVACVPRSSQRGLFALKAAALAAAAMASYFPRDLLLWGLPLEAVVLLLLYKRQHNRHLLQLSVLLSVITVLVAAMSLNLPGHRTFAGYEIASSMLGLWGASMMFAVLAALYEHSVPRLRPAPPMRRRKGDRIKPAFQLRPAGTAVLHAAATAFLLMSYGILHWGGDPLLPFILTLMAAGGALVGFMLRTPQIEVGAVLLLGAAHVCFHIFYWAPVAGFVDHPWFDVGAGLLAAITFGAARAWERYLVRIQRHAQQKGAEENWTADLEHQMIAALPYVGATFILTTLTDHLLPAPYLPGVQGAIGVAFVLVGYRYDLNGIKASGVFATAAATLSFYTQVYATPEFVANRPLFVAAMAGYLAAMTLAERLVAFLESREANPSRIEDVLRSSMVAVLMTMGALGLFEVAPSLLLPVALLGFGALLMIVGFFFHESRYRWASLAVFAASVGAAFVGLDFNHISSFLSFAAAAIVLLGVSWLYTRRPIEADTPTSGPHG
ncbi:MAG: DUF2339 domain-containing protein [Candidatus Hydrogenedens sp.]|nr:DUF2339 domain-containing protein [Candidatus Hydrogenedens sp.]